MKFQFSNKISLLEINLLPTLPDHSTKKCTNYDNQSTISMKFYRFASNFDFSANNTQKILPKNNCKQALIDFQKLLQVILMVTSILVTKSFVDNFPMLVTVSAISVTNMLYLSTLASARSLRAPTSKRCH